jgi:hypothetical protein
MTQQTGDLSVKMAGTGIQSFAKLRAQILRGMPQTTGAF